MKIILWLLRIIVGVLFIFSGLVKANDPLGLSYKMKEFLEVLHIDFLHPYALQFSVVMIIFEIVAGVALLLGYAFRVFSFLLLLLTLFFTFLTGFALYSGKIKECGCFGDCIKISNHETFYKDVVLTIMIIVLLIFRDFIKPLLPKVAGTVVILLAFAASLGIQLYVLSHLPFYDCLPYKKGNNIWAKMQPPPGSKPDKYKTYMVYEKDGVRKDFDETNYPWQDTTWKFVDSKSVLVEKGNAEPEIKDFSLTDYQQNDVTQQILEQKGYTFLLFVKEPATAHTDNMDRILTLITVSNQLNIPFYILCSAAEKEMQAFVSAHKLQGAAGFLIIDGTVAKTAMRSNPGLMLIKDGTVEGKWSYKDYPGTISLNNGLLSIH